ncbi:hypothetical protein NE626_16140, partial [Intestinimonas massiliensis]|uniref:hypothetical protein n=1 Tax=Intestinimonas massiliensis (ex Afouda et al. 2020) TaxID=1673721 RepID=UPI00210C9772
LLHRPAIPRPDLLGGLVENHPSTPQEQHVVQNGLNIVDQMVAIRTVRSSSRNAMTSFRM